MHKLDYFKNTFVIITDIGNECLQSGPTVSDITMVLIGTLCGSSRTDACCEAGQTFAS